MANKNTELRDAFELFGPSVEILKKYPQVFGLLTILPAVLSSLTEKPSSVTFLGGLLSLVFLGPSVYAATRAAGGHKITLSESFKKGFPYFLRLFGLVIILAAVIFVGLLLFIVPGLIAIRRYALSPYYLVDRNLGIFEAMDQAADETKPFEWAIYSMIGVAVLAAFISIFGVIGMIVGLAMSIAYSMAFALRYFEVKKAFKKL